MDFLFDLLKVFWPLLIIYIISRIQRALRTQKERAEKARHLPADPEIQERLQRRAETLAVKQLRKQPPARISSPQPKQYQPIAAQPNDPYDENKAEQLSEEDLIEKIGIAEYERRVEKGEIPAEEQHVPSAPRYTAELHNNATAVLQTMPLRQFVIAREIFDKPRALRPHRPPFRS